MADKPTLHIVTQANVWTAVLAAGMASGLTLVMAIGYADAAVEAMTERLPPITTQQELEKLIAMLAGLQAQVDEIKAGKQ